MLLLILTASGYVPGGSGTKIHNTIQYYNIQYTKKQNNTYTLKTIHNPTTNIITQNNTYRFSLFTIHLLLISHHLSLVTCRLSLFTYHLSPKLISHHVSLVILRLSLITYHSSLFTLRLSRFTWPCIACHLSVGTYHLQLMAYHL